MGLGVNVFSTILREFFHNLLRLFAEPPESSNSNTIPFSTVSPQDQILRTQMPALRHRGGGGGRGSTTPRQ